MPKVSKTSKIHLVIHLEFQVKVQIKIKKKIKIKIMILRESVIPYTRPTPPPLLKNLFWLLMGETQTEEHEVPVQGDPQPDPVSEEAVQEEVQGVGIDPQTLELSRRWSKNAPKPVKVRMSPQQAAIVAAEPPMFDPPSRVQAASFQPPTGNRVISADEEKIIIPASAWTEMLGAMLDGLGLRDLASAGVVKAKRDANGTLETLCKMSPKFRTKDGIQELFGSWARARPDYPVPKPAWLEEHASLFLAGKVRYQDEKRTKQHERRSPGSDGNRAVNAEDLYPEYSRFA